MSPEKYLRTYKVAELERIGQTQLKELKEQGNFSIPVDIDRIAENIHGIDIDVMRGLKENHHIWGMVANDVKADKLVILLDDQLLDLDHLQKVYRMTVAEELAHVLLHKRAICKVKDIEGFKKLQNHYDWHKNDRNAKRLAASLLMPAEHILKDSRSLYTQIVEAVGYGNPEAIQKYLANKLAEKYQVSIESMKIRLKEWPIKVMEKINQAMKNKLDFLE